MTIATTGDHEAIFWSLKEFALGKDLTSEIPTIIFVDRATHEFGLVYYDTNAVAVVERFPDTEEPAFFPAKHALAACWHNKCNKISILLKQTQVDLTFHTPTEARDFLDTFEDAAASTQNISFCTYEHHSLNKLKDRSFDMVDENIAGRVVQTWIDAHKTTSEWTSLRASGEWSDFTIAAGDKSFAVHRVKLCKESDYFRAICSGDFVESNNSSIKLPESERTIEVLLDEIYDAYNATTGSLFTGFALRSDMEKERLLNDLLDLFVAADKYNLEKIKSKVAKAMIDRMPFIRDVLTVVDLATSIFDEQCPQVDCGLRKAIIVQLHNRMPAVIEYQAAWNEYSESKALLKALHTHMFHHAGSAGPRAVDQAAQCFSPPPTPTRGRKRRIS